MRRTLYSFLLPIIFLSDGNFATIIKNRKEEAEKLLNTEWFKETLQKRISESGIDLEDIEKRNQEILSETRPCFSGKTKEKYTIMVFVSLSMPLNLWKEYSHSLEKLGGAFVINGLPENSFAALAKTYKTLRENGIHAPIILNPKLFEKYLIVSVPAIVHQNDKEYDKVSGSISLEYALELFAQYSKNKKEEGFHEKI